jgi:hypothetical protein
MHQPGYVQGGQEVGRGYLLLGIHYRRIREHSTAGATTPHPSLVYLIMHMQNIKIPPRIKQREGSIGFFKCLNTLQHN